MFDELTEKLESTFARRRGKGTLTEADIKEGLREVRRVLPEADVNFQLTRECLERGEKEGAGGRARGPAPRAPASWAASTSGWRGGCSSASGRRRLAAARSEPSPPRSSWSRSSTTSLPEC